MPRGAVGLCGIYFLLNRGEIVYVGQTTNILRRLIRHNQERTKVYDAVSFLACRPDELDDLELVYVEALVPRHNFTLSSRRTPSPIP